jgi:hypothetical protein
MHLYVNNQQTLDLSQKSPLKRASGVSGYRSGDAGDRVWSEASLGNG